MGIIRITGKKGNCEAASQALLELVPIEAQVAVPYEFHRFIIGQKGMGVREMMNTYDVNIRVPSQEAKSDLVIISGVPSNVEAAKVGLAEKLAELEAEKEEKIKNSFVVRVCVAPEYHPKIIGRKGAVITKLRDDFKVNIQLLKMEVNIDAKVHSMIIGRGGNSIRNIMEKYKVDIRLPRAGDEDPTLVVVSGDQDACEDCIDHL